MSAIEQFNKRFQSSSGGTALSDFNKKYKVSGTGIYDSSHDYGIPQPKAPEKSATPLPLPSVPSLIKDIPKLSATLPDRPLTPLVSMPSNPRDLKADIVSKASTLPATPEVSKAPKSNLISGTVKSLLDLIPFSNITQNKGKLTPIGEGLGNLYTKTVLAPFSPAPVGAPSTKEQALSPEFKTATKQPSAIEQGVNAVAGRAFLSEGPAAIEAAKGAAGAVFGGQYLKNLPQTIQSIKQETDPQKKLSMIVETLGGTALAAAGALHLVNTVRELPTEKTVPLKAVQGEPAPGTVIPGEKVTVSNAAARDAQSGIPNPAIDKPTAELLARAMNDNKRAMIDQLKSGNNITFKAPDTITPTHAVVPTFYGKLLNILQGKLSRGENLTPAEATVVRDVVKNPEVYIPQKPAEMAPAGTLFHGSENGLLKVDNNGNINLGTNKDEIAQFGKPLDISTKNLKIKDLGTKENLFNTAADPNQKAHLIAQGVDIIKAENHAIAINPEDFAQKTGSKLRPSPREQSIGDLMQNNPQEIPLSSLTSYEGAPDKTQVAKIVSDYQKGIPLQPITVKPDSLGNLGVEDGKHRLEAAKQLGLDTIPVKDMPVGSRPGPLEPTGISKIGKSIEAKAIEDRLTKGFEGVAGYDKITIKDQAEKAAKLMTNMDEARKVVRGEAPLPAGLRGTALITAIEEHLKVTRDPQLAYELANSPLVSETSAAAQEMRLAAEREPDSLTAKLQDLKKAKEAAFEKKTGKSGEAETKKLATEYNKEVKAITPKVTKQSWADFINTLEC